MLRIDRGGKSLAPLDQGRIADVGLQERYDIQRMIRQSPDSFFREMGEPLLLIGEEIRPADAVDDRIDLLAIDEQGAADVIELKRGSNKLHLVQALSYAVMVAKWERGRLALEYSRSFGRSLEESEQQIEEFLDEEVTSLNETQRVILIAEGFEYEVLVTTDRLAERYSVDGHCHLLSLSVDGTNEYPTCTCIYPPPEITAHAERRRRRGETWPSRWSSWDQVLAAIENPAIRSFFEAELKVNRECYLRRRALRFRVNGRRRFNVLARRKLAYVWQYGRFERDAEFWESQIGKHAEIEPVKDVGCLRF